MTTDTRSLGLKAAILSLSLLTIMAAAAVSPALAKISQAFPEVSRTLIKLTLTLPALLIIPFSLLSGWLASRWMPRKVLILGLVVFCIGGMGGGLAQSIVQLLCFRALLGAGVGLIMPLSTSLIADFYEGEARTKMMGLSGALSHLGGVVFLSVSGWLACFSWRHAFAVYGLAVLSLGLVLRHLPAWQRKAQESGDVRIPGGVWYCALLGALMMIAFYAVPTNLALFIENEEGLFVSQVPLFESREQLAESLRTGEVPEATRERLRQNGVELAGKVTIAEDTAGKRWLLKDDRRTIVVKRVKEGLMVCKERLGRPAIAGLVLSAMTLAGVLSGLILAPLSKALRAFFPAMTILVMGLGFSLLAVAQSMTVVVAGVMCIGLSSGFMMPLLLLQVSRTVTPVSRAMAMAIASAGVYLGQFTSPIVLEALGRDSFRAQFVILAAGLGVALAIALAQVVLGKPGQAPAEPVRVH